MKLKNSVKIQTIILIPLVLIMAAHNAAAKINIVSTIPDFGAIASEIGKEYVNVTSLVRPTQDPHFVDAKPSFAVTLNRADMVLVTGMELEGGWLPPLLKNARNNRIQEGAPGYVDCSGFIEAMEVQAVNRAKGDIHPGGNPHYWTDPRNGVRIASGIAAVLSQLDSKHQEIFERNARSFIERLNQKMAQWQKLLRQKGHRNVVVYHDSWKYFLNFAGIHQVGTLEPKPGVPPSASHVAKLISTVQDQKGTIVLQESYYPTNLSRLFAEKAHAKLKVLPTMVGAAGTRDYIDLIDRMVMEITK